MQFTYDAYRSLLSLLSDCGYTFADYHNSDEHNRCVVLRHDIDTSIEDAVALAEVESEYGVKSTWFVLLKTDFYNIASAKNLSLIRQLTDMGHEIGLHYDEKSYGESVDVPQTIVDEAHILADICGFPITTVSMHRPSKKTLASNYEIPGMVNSYGYKFFNEYKYLSDSRRRWREPVEDIVRSKEYKKLHILTHAFWYRETEEVIANTVGRFIMKAQRERYNQLEENITDLQSIIAIEDIE